MDREKEGGREGGERGMERGGVGGKEAVCEIILLSWRVSSVFFEKIFLDSRKKSAEHKTLNKQISFLAPKAERLCS